MSRIFLDIPDDIEDKILLRGPSLVEQPLVYRCITHTGKLVPSDFYPTFKDEEQLEYIRKGRQKGGMANVVFSIEEERNNLKFYAVSLFLSKNDAEAFIKRKESNKRRFPAIAVGEIDSNKGIVHKDNSYHLSYYLYDYINKNPYLDFESINYEE